MAAQRKKIPREQQPTKPVEEDDGLHLEITEPTMCQTMAIGTTIVHELRRTPLNQLLEGRGLAVKNIDGERRHCQHRGEIKFVRRVDDDTRQFVTTVTIQTEELVSGDPRYLDLSDDD